MISASIRTRVGSQLLASVAAMAILACMPAIAHGASPAWKLLAATGPTHVPHRQSEVQKVTVAAEGGTFALGLTTAEGEGTPIVQGGSLDTTSGSPTATIDGVAAGASFAVGNRLVGVGIPPETKVTACSADCETQGSTVTLSKDAELTESVSVIEIYTRGLSGVTGSFHVGDEVAGNFFGSYFEYFPVGTVVTAVGSGTLTLSDATTQVYGSAEGAFGLTGVERTVPLGWDAFAGEVQGALAALTALGPGAATVSGGPGGNAASPYLVAFAGPLADQNVPGLSASNDLAGQHAYVHISTTVPGGAGTGEISVDPANIGGLPTSGEYTVTVGPLPPDVVTAGPTEGPEWVCPGGAGEDEVTCTSSAVVQALGAANGVNVPIEIRSGDAATSTVPVVISGAGGGTATYQMPIMISDEPTGPGVQAFWGGSFDAEGKEETRAGAHPYSAQTYFVVNTLRSPSGKINPVQDSKNVTVDLPPGFTGNPLVTPRCPQSMRVLPEVPNTEEYRESPACNKEMSVGRFAPVLSLFQGSNAFSTAISNDVPVEGAAAQFTTRIAFPQQSLLASVRSADDYGIRIVAPNNPNYNKIYGAYVALEGFPAGAHGKPFLTTPTDCAEEARKAPLVTATFDTYQEPGKSIPAIQQSLPAVTGCENLKFHPDLAFQPDSTIGSSPVGATAHLHIPQDGLVDAEQLAAPELKKAVVSLPAGLTLNPASANGLQSCSEDQMGYLGSGFESPNPIRFDEAPVGCPAASKLGTAQIVSPLLEQPINGTIYLADQDANPSHSLVALYLVVEDPRFGITLKLPGEVQSNPVTGQLTATFDYNPQLPFEDLTLHFRGGGPRSELATPEVCGHYATTGSLEPWSAPESGPPAQINEAGFTVNTGCSPSAATRPFVPTFEAGSTSTQAGSYTPIVIKINRKDGEQELSSLNFTLPKGLTGKLAGVSYCPEAAIFAARVKSGKAEQAVPSCPASSQIGSVDTAAGVGTEPIHVGGNVYLAGPYKGAPLSSVVITPAVAGPFDLGDVVIRAPLFVDLQTAEITAKSDPIPTILKGIPLKLRSVAINLDRPSFGLNPTSCEVKAITASMGSSDGATAAPTNRFQVGGCNKLKFKPKLKLSLKGAVKRAGHPALKAVVTYPKKGSYSNIARAQVGLPHSEFLDQDNLENVCTQPQLKTQTCPKKSIYGKAKAWTPLLDKPLEGPVYLGVGFGYKLPALVADLNGQIRILLKGKVDTDPRGGIRNTFEAVPDAPVSRFVLEMKGGKKYGLLENSENICKKTQRASVRLNAQNGLVQQLHPLIGNSCKGKKKGKAHKKHGKGGKGPDKG